MRVSNFGTRFPSVWPGWVPLLRSMISYQKVLLKWYLFFFSRLIIIHIVLERDKERQRERERQKETDRKTEINYNVQYVSHMYSLIHSLVTPLPGRERGRVWRHCYSNMCFALRSVCANQIARATCYFPSHVIVMWLLSQWRREDNQIHGQCKKISELKATLAAHSWTRLQRHRSQRSSYLYDIKKCLNYSAFVLMIALDIMKEQS